MLLPVATLSVWDWITDHVGESVGERSMLRLIEQKRALLVSTFRPRHAHLLDASERVPTVRARLDEVEHFNFVGHDDLYIRISLW